MRRGFNPEHYTVVMKHFLKKQCGFVTAKSVYACWIEKYPTFMKRSAPESRRQFIGKILASICPRSHGHVYVNGYCERSGISISEATCECEG